jgi:hypothetical protein
MSAMVRELAGLVAAVPGAPEPARVEADLRRAVAAALRVYRRARELRLALIASGLPRAEAYRFVPLAGGWEPSILVEQLRQHGQDPRVVAELAEAVDESLAATEALDRLAGSGVPALMLPRLLERLLYGSLAVHDMTEAMLVSAVEAGDPATPAARFIARWKADLPDEGTDPVAKLAESRLEWTMLERPVRALHRDQTRLRELLTRPPDGGQPVAFDDLLRGLTLGLRDALGTGPGRPVIDPMVALVAELARVLDQLADLPASSELRELVGQLPQALHNVLSATRSESVSREALVARVIAPAADGVAAEVRRARWNRLTPDQALQIMGLTSPARLTPPSVPVPGVPVAEAAGVRQSRWGWSTLPMADDPTGVAMIDALRHAVASERRLLELAQLARTIDSAALYEQASSADPEREPASVALDLAGGLAWTVASWVRAEAARREAAELLTWQLRADGYGPRDRGFLADQLSQAAHQLADRFQLTEQQRRERAWGEHQAPAELPVAEIRERLPPRLADLPADYDGLISLLVRTEIHANLSFEEVARAGAQLRAAVPEWQSAAAPAAPAVSPPEPAELVADGSGTRRIELADVLAAARRVVESGVLNGLTISPRDRHRLVDRVELDGDRIVAIWPDGESVRFHPRLGERRGASDLVPGGLAGRRRLPIPRELNPQLLPLVLIDRIVTSLLPSELQRRLGPVTAPLVEEVQLDYLTGRANALLRLPQLAAEQVDELAHLRYFFQLQLLSGLDVSFDPLGLPDPVATGQPPATAPAEPQPVASPESVRDLVLLTRQAGPVGRDNRPAELARFVEQVLVGVDRLAGGLPDQLRLAVERNLAALLALAPPALELAEYVGPHFLPGGRRQTRSAVEFAYATSEPDPDSLRSWLADRADPDLLAAAIDKAQRLWTSGGPAREHAQALDLLVTEAELEAGRESSEVRLRAQWLTQLATAAVGLIRGQLQVFEAAGQLAAEAGREARSEAAVADLIGQVLSLAGREGPEVPPARRPQLLEQLLDAGPVPLRGRLAARQAGPASQGMAADLFDRALRAVAAERELIRLAGEGPPPAGGRSAPAAPGPGAGPAGGPAAPPRRRPPAAPSGSPEQEGPGPPDSGPAASAAAAAAAADRRQPGRG